MQKAEVMVNSLAEQLTGSKALQKVLGVTKGWDQLNRAGNLEMEKNLQMLFYPGVPVKPTFPP